MDFSIFDLIIGSIILLLGLKGIINGFFKELFGLIGIVGGIFIASRVATDVGTLLSDAIFKFDSPAAINFLGFLVTLSVFWGVMIGSGILLKKFSKVSGLGILDRIFGFILGAGKFFFIFAVITYVFFNFKTVRSNFDIKDSFMLPILIETGDFIMHIDGDKLADVNSSIDSAVKKAKESLKDEGTQILLKSASQEKEKLINEVSKTLKENNISLQGVE